MIAARIARRLVRKLLKPAALWLTERQIGAAVYEITRLTEMREEIVGIVNSERVREIALIERLNAIRNW